MGLSERDLAWLAGIWDGEGTITLTRGSGRNHKVGMAVCVSNTNTAIMERVEGLVSAIVGRPIRARLRPCPSFARRRPIYRLQVASKADVRKFCETLHPYLVGKATQALLMLRYLETCPGTGNGRLDGPAIIHEQERLLRMMYSLNNPLRLGRRAERADVALAEGRVWE